MMNLNPWRGYELRLSTAAKKFFDRIDEKNGEAIWQKLKALVGGALNLDILKLQGNYELPTYRLRVGSFRVIYEVYKKNIIIYVVTIDNRKDVYKH